MSRTDVVKIDDERKQVWVSTGKGRVWRKDCCCKSQETRIEGEEENSFKLFGKFEAAEVQELVIRKAGWRRQRGMHKIAKDGTSACTVTTKYGNRSN